MSTALEVNGCRVNASTNGGEYWAWFAKSHANTGRITVIDSTIIADVSRVSCDDKDHAQWLKDTFEANGIDKSALKIVTVAEQS